MAVAIVIPALGPSLGIAPAGTCTWNARFSNASSSIPSCGAERAHRRDRDLRGLLHHVAELTREDELVAVLVGRRLDEEDVATRRRRGEAGRHAGHCGPLRGLAKHLLAAERVAHGGLVDLDGGLDLLRRDLRRGLAQDRPELALELADARLARVLGDDELDRLVGDRDLVLVQAVPLALARPQVVARDRDLLVGRVAVEPDHLHPVEERPRDGLGHVPGGDEDDLGEIELDIEVVVAERVVLRRVEHLEQCRGRISAPVGADLVDLVEHDRPGSSSPRRGARGRAGPEARRCRCGDARGSRPRHGCRRATCGRTRARSRGRSTRRSRSCPFRAGR